MSEGSYEKDGGSSEDHESFGSAKGSRSSGNSSLSPHNSMEGSPRMQQSQSMQFQPQIQHSSTPGVNLGKKTIRNYTPKESSNMLREFEDRRNNSVDYRDNKRVAKNHSRSKPRLERKSSVERMIDDFHRNLPPPGVENRQQETSGNQNGHQPNDSTINTSENASKKASKNGTMNSQISNWSAASSAASFDYQPAFGLKKTKSTDLPSLDEDPDHDDLDDEPDFERVPPEGMAASVKGQSPVNHSPTNFVQRIEVKNRSPSPPKKGPKKKSSREDLLPPPPPPPPPMPAEEAEDEFSNLRKLISEGRIAGLNEKPPSFIPPSPPSSPKKEEKSGHSRRPSSAANAKPPAPSTPKTPKSGASVERGPSKKNHPAPKPPISNVSTPSSEVKFVSSRAREPSLEDLTKMSNKKRSEVKRSSSNHGTRPSGNILKVIISLQKYLTK